MAKEIVSIGNSGYMDIVYHPYCGGPKIVPFPYEHDEIAIHLYYQDSAGVKHEFPYVRIYNAFPYNDLAHAYNEEVEWKLPISAYDGTIVPWIQGGKYYMTVKLPDNVLTYTINLAAPFMSDAAYYSQRNISRVMGTADCPIPYRIGADYDWWMNVTR